MKIKAFTLAVIATVASINFGYSVTTNWTGLSGVDTTDWSDATNWSAGAPTITTVANMVYPAGDAADIFISADSSALGLIYGADLTYYKFVTTGSGVTLTIGSSGITNLSTSALNDSAVPSAINQPAATALGASCTFSAGTLGLEMSGALDIKTNTLTVATGAGTLILDGGTSFSVSSPTTYGKIAGTGPVQLSGPLTFDFTAAVGAGTWDFINQTSTGTLTSLTLTDSYSGAFTETTPGSWDATAGGLTWNYKATTGILTAVPEPATWALLAGGLTTVLVFRRRRSQV